MAAPDIRKCPHCGASVSGDTDRCPSCDRRLEVDIDPVHDMPELAQVPPDISDANVMTFMEPEDDNPADTKPGSDTDRSKPVSVGDADQNIVTASIPTNLPEMEPLIDPSLLETHDPGNDVLPDALQTGIIDTPTPLGALIVGPRPRDKDDHDDATLDEPDERPTRVDNNLDHGALEQAAGTDRLSPEHDEEDVESEENQVEDENFENRQTSIDPTPQQALSVPYEALAEQPTTPPTTYPDVDEDAPTYAALPEAEAATDIRPASVPTSSTFAPTPAPEPTPLPPLEEQTAHSMSYSKPIEIPSAPFTPPPVMSSSPPAPAMQPAPQQALPYSYQYAPTMPPNWGQNLPSDYWLQQRIKAYELAGYKIERNNEYEALLSMGKKLPFVWWIVAGMSVFGVLWYFLILLTSGFRKEKVYIGLEPDGYVFEEGAASAHIRRRRARSGRRWGLTGIVVAILSTFLFFMLLIAASVIMNGYKAELNAAYPELTFFDDPGDTQVSQSDVQDVRIIVAVMVVMFTLAVLGMLGGVMLAVISYIQAAAYRVDVVPLPGYD